MAVPVQTGATFTAGAPAQLFQARFANSRCAATTGPTPDGQRFLVRRTARPRSGAARGGGAELDGGVAKVMHAQRGGAMIPARASIAVAGVALVTGALLRAGTPAGPASPSQAPRAAELPAIALREAPAFPLPAHVESSEIAAGAYTFARLFAAGDALFHTSFNGLDGVGSAVRKDGSKVSRFAPPGPRGPGSQACGECHAVPFGASAGLAHSSVGRAKKGTHRSQRALGDLAVRQRHPAAAGAGDDRGIAGRPGTPPRPLRRATPGTPVSP